MTNQSKIAVEKTPLADLLLIKPKVFGDERGWFYESFNAQEFLLVTGINTIFVQDNHSKSKKGILRGLHFQTNHAQGKLVRVTQGAVFDVVVDLRKKSPSYGKWFGVELSAENQLQLWIPQGYAHGFLVLSDFAEFLYKTTDYYDPQSEVSLAWNDPFLNIAWPIQVVGNQPILNAKDSSAKSWDEIPKF